MRYRLLFGAALALGMLAAFAACGGSSSETPPPLQPDPAGFRYASAAPLRIGDDNDAGSAPSTRSENSQASEVGPQPRVPARSTWGTGTGAAPH